MINLKKVIKGIRFSLHLTFSMKEGWKYSVFKFFIVIFNNITPIVLTIFPGLIINELLYHKRLDYIVGYVLIISFTPLIQTLVNLLSNKYLISLEKNLNLRLMSNFYLYILKMDYETLENPALQEELWRSKTTYTESIGIIDQVITFLVAIINVIVYSIIIIRYNFSIIIIIAIIICINFFVKKKVQEEVFESNKEFENFLRLLICLISKVMAKNFVYLT